MAKENLPSGSSDFESPLSLNSQGLFYYFAHRYQEVLNCYVRSLELEPYQVEIWNNLGLSLHALGRFEEALTAYGWALFFNPIDADVLNNRGIIYSELAVSNSLFFQPALLDFNRSLTIEPGSIDVLINRGNLFYEFGCYLHALADFNQIITFHPEEINEANNQDMMRKYLICFYIYNLLLQHSYSQMIPETLPEIERLLPISRQ